MNPVVCSNVSACASVVLIRLAYIKCVVPVSEFCVKDLDQLSAEPSALGVGLVFEEVGFDLAETWIKETENKTYHSVRSVAHTLPSGSLSFALTKNERLAIVKVILCVQQIVLWLDKVDTLLLFFGWLAVDIVAMLGLWVALGSKVDNCLSWCCFFFRSRNFRSCVRGLWCDLL